MMMMKSNNAGVVVGISVFVWLWISCCNTYCYSFVLKNDPLSTTTNRISSSSFESSVSLLSLKLLHENNRQRSNTHVLFSSTTPTEENDNKEQKEIETTSFEQAGASLIDEEDQERMKQMGDFDSNPESREDNMERMRESIRARAANLGVEKSKVSQEYFQQAQERAKANVGNAAPPGLDLSKISTVEDKAAGTVQGLNRGEWDEQLPTMLYNPEDEMSEEEKKEVDKVGQLPFWEQALEELKNAKWPTPGAALREVGLMAVVVAITAVIIIGWDKVLRGIYTDFGFIPKTEDIAATFQGLELPDGWTNNMSDQDIASFQEDMSTVMSTPSISTTIDSVKESVTAGSLPDL